MPWILVAALAALSACTSVTTVFEEIRRDAETVVSEAPIPVPDGPPLIATVDVQAIPEPVPVPEPIARRGNPESYQIDGVTYRVTPYRVGQVETGIGSWYGRKFHGQLTSSGEPYDMFQLTAAHKTMPIPAWVRVTNLDNQRSVVLRVNDRGPFVGDRMLDLSWAAAERLGYATKGTAPLRMEVLVVPEEDSSLVANPLVPPRQAILQVAALSDSVRADQLASELSKLIDRALASVRVEPNGTGLFRVQVLPATDERIIQSVEARLIAEGFQPTRLIAP
ncbi:MAG: septal ring lytic transglycosylase RlpA family protein [Litorivicinaceae bacterium]